MDRELHILILEDCPADAELLQRTLRGGGIRFSARCVDSRSAFVEQLAAFSPDLILSDYTMPTFNGLEALELCRVRALETPFVFVSGTLGEEQAVEALRRGATDYVLKGHLARLVPAVLRALRDFDERAERRQLEEQYRQAQKMEAVGRLAGGVAHDFNNLLTAIAGYSDILLSRMPDDNPSRREIEEIRRAGDRAATLTRQLLAFSRKQIIELRVLDINVVVAGIGQLLSRVIGEDIDLRTVLEPRLGLVKVDSGQIEQVIMNLAVNARDAMPGGGTLTIETAVAELGPGATDMHLSLEPGPYIRLAVTDTGCGMDAETLSRLFEPFFTTKEAGRGTGLGLATVYGIVKQHGGDIRVDSEPGKGSTFEIYLPRVSGEVESQAGGARRPVGGGSETVLLVEDDAMVRSIAREILTSRGYHVLEAANGEEALELCRRFEGPIPLVVTDMVMPQMSGRELAIRLRETRPQTNVLYTSGYTSNEIDRQGALIEGVAFLQKPFTPADLARRVRETLDN